MKTIIAIVITAVICITATYFLKPSTAKKIDQYGNVICDTNDVLIAKDTSKIWAWKLDRIRANAFRLRAGNIDTLHSRLYTDTIFGIVNGITSNILDPKNNPVFKK